MGWPKDKSDALDWIIRDWTGQNEQTTHDEVLSELHNNEHRRGQDLSRHVNADDFMAAGD